jgi:hypothetical protein
MVLDLVDAVDVCERLLGWADPDCCAVLCVQAVDHGGSLTEQID